jgi:alpha-galactosidase
MPVELVYKGGRAALKDREIPFHDSLSLDGLKIQLSFGEGEIRGTVQEEKELFLERVELEFEIRGEYSFFKNGFQSWSPSLEIKREPPPPRILIKALALHWDDPGYLKEISYFQKSHFLTYLRSGDQYLYLEAQDLPIPLVHFLFRGKTLKVVSEIRRSGPNQFTFLDLKMERLSALHPARKKMERIFGWTSWYYYYNRVRPEDVLLNLELSRNFPFPLTYFQIDDGWEKAIGDWEENKKFKGRLRELALKIKDTGYRPGIWLAPFIVEKKSRTFKRRDWLLKDESGKFQVAGFNPVWGGYFYALDPTHPEVQSYLRERIETFREMGFELFKMDYLYSLALQGEHFKENLSRREVIEEGLSLLNSACGEALILGCGAPLLTSRAYDFLRIGPDLADKWEDKLIRLAGHIGGVEAKSCLNNTLSRFFLDGRFWLSDPDVLILRRGKLNPEQSRTLILANFLLSHFHFYSDPLNIVPKENLELLRTLEPFLDFSPEEGIPGEYFTFRGKSGRKEVLGFINLKSRSFEVRVEEGFKEVLTRGRGNLLEPFQTRAFAREESNISL